MSLVSKGISLSKKKGFTLVELVVVITIIGLISSIVLSSIIRARSKARDSHRIAQLSMVQDALELYWTDRRYYPPNTTSNTAWTSTSTWSSNIQAQLVANGYIRSVPLDPVNLLNCNGTADCYYRYYRYVSGTTAVACNGSALHLYEYVLTFSVELPTANAFNLTGDSNMNKCIPGPRK